MAIETAKELGKELKKGPDTVEVSIKMGKIIIKLKGVGKVAWAIAIGAIGVAVAAPTTGGTSSALAAVSAPAAASILGVSTTTAAISIAVAGGGVAVLNKLRKYEVVEKHNTYMVLKRK